MTSIDSEAACLLGHCPLVILKSTNHNLVDYDVTSINRSSRLSLTRLLRSRLQRAGQVKSKIPVSPPYCRRARTRCPSRWRTMRPRRSASILPREAAVAGSARTSCSTPSSARRLPSATPRYHFFVIIICGLTMPAQ